MLTGSASSELLPSPLSDPEISKASSSSSPEGTSGEDGSGSLLAEDRVCEVAVCDVGCGGTMAFAVCVPSGRLPEGKGTMVGGCSGAAGRVLGGLSLWADFMCFFSL